MDIAIATLMGMNDHFLGDNNDDYRCFFIILKDMSWGYYDCKIAGFMDFLCR